VKDANFGVCGKRARGQFRRPDRRTELPEKSGNIARLFSFGSTGGTRADGDTRERNDNLIDHELSARDFTDGEAHRFTRRPANSDSPQFDHELLARHCAQREVSTAVSQDACDLAPCPHVERAHQGEADREIPLRASHFTLKRLRDQVAGSNSKHAEQKCRCLANHYDTPAPFNH